MTDFLHAVFVITLLSSTSSSVNVFLLFVIPVLGIRASSSNYPDFYYGDIITVTCDLGPLENPNALALFGLMRNGSGEVIGCSVTRSPSGNSYNPHQANKLGPSAEQCIEFFTALLADTAASLDLMFEVSQPISYQCLKWDYGDADYSFLEGKLTISKFLSK